MTRRFVVTHFDERSRLRRLTFAKQGRHTYPTSAEAEAALALFRQPSGLPKVLTPNELASLEVREVACYDGHLDPVAY